MGEGRRNLVPRPCYPNHWESKVARKSGQRGLGTRLGGRQCKDRWRGEDGRKKSKHMISNVQCTLEPCTKMLIKSTVKFFPLCPPFFLPSSCPSSLTSA